MAAKALRPIRIDGNTAYVRLSNGAEAAIDADDVHLAHGYNWSAKQHGRTIYAVRAGTKEDGKRRKIYLHRLIMGEPPLLEVDHVSGDGLDCRKLNLRIATRAENTKNRRRPENSASSLKGAHWRKDASKWTSTITSDGRPYFLGYFDTPEDAHAAYCMASERLHGEFGRVG